MVTFGQGFLPEMGVLKQTSADLSGREERAVALLKESSNRTFIHSLKGASRDVLLLLVLENSRMSNTGGERRGAALLFRRFMQFSKRSLGGSLRGVRS